MPKRLKQRIKSLVKTIRDCRNMTERRHAFSGQAAQYIQSGAQRDLVKLHAKSREAQLAYAFLRYRPYLMVEKCRPGNDPHWGHVQQVIRDHSTEDTGSEEWSAVLQRFSEWRDSDETKMSNETRDMLHKRWLGQREASSEAKGMVERAAAIAREGG